MKAILKFALYFFSVLFLSAVLAPVLYRICPKISASLSQYLSFVEADAFDWKFERIYNRLVMIFSLTAIFLAVRSKKIDFPKESIKWDKKQSFYLFGVGFLWGFALLVVIVILKFFLGVVEFRITHESASFWIERIGMSILAAMIIGIIEEIFFRGFCFVTILKKTKNNLVLSIVLVNIFYAILHYVQGKKPFIGPDPNIIDGLKLMAAPFMSLVDWQPILPGMIGLFIYGVILSVVYLKTRSLYPCIGIHAGCVFFLKLDGAFFFHHNNNPLFYGSSNCYDGVLGWITLIFMGWLMVSFFSKRKSSFKMASLIIFSLMLVPWVSLNAYAQSELSEEITNSEEEPLSALEMWKRKKQALDKYEPQVATKVEAPTSNEVEETNKRSVQDEVDKNQQKKELVQSSKDTKELIESDKSSSAKLDLKRKIEKKIEVNQANDKDLGYEEAFAKTKTKNFAEAKKLDITANLESARIVNVNQDFESVEGYWNGSSFSFNDNDAALINVREQIIGGESRKGVYLECLPHTTRRLQFEGVQSGQSLKLGYGMADSAFKKDETLTVYLKIWVGKKLIQRTAIFNEKGWHEEIIDLGPSSFLRASLTVTFEITAGDVHSRYLTLDAKMAHKV